MTPGHEMLEFTENLGAAPAAAEAISLRLDFGERSRGRQRIRLDDGGEIGIVLPHGGGRLADGDVLRSADGRLAVVRCRPEEVITAAAADWPSLARAAYHLGNRHIALQIGELWLRLQPDPVLEKMTAALGLSIKHELAVFDPEPGAGGGRERHHHSRG